MLDKSGPIPYTVKRPQVFIVIEIEAMVVIEMDDVERAVRFPMSGIVADAYIRKLGRGPELVDTGEGGDAIGQSLQ